LYHGGLFPGKSSLYPRHGKAGDAASTSHARAGGDVIATSWRTASHGTLPTVCGDMETEQREALVKRRPFLILLTLLLLVGIPMGLLVRWYRHEQASRDLIVAIAADNTNAALSCLEAGAYPNARDYSEDTPLTFGEHMRQLLDRVVHPNAKIDTQR